MKTAIIFGLTLIAVAIIFFILGAECIRYKIRNNLESSYFGTMYLNMNIKDNDNFVETEFNHNPRELLSREMVLFDIKIRE